MPTVDATKYRNRDNDPRGPYFLVVITAPLLRPALIFDWRGFVPPDGRSWRYTADRLDELDRNGAIHFPRSGLPRLKRYQVDITPTQPVERSTLSPVEFIVREAMRTLAGEIARNPDSLNQIEWRDLERVLREVFEELGFDTELTRPGKDGGFDLKLTCVEDQITSTFLVEVKHWVVGAKKAGLPRNIRPF